MTRAEVPRAAPDIRLLGTRDPRARRLLAEAVPLMPEADGTPPTLVLSSGGFEDGATLPEGEDAILSSRWRILVVSSAGAHPDAGVARLRNLWDLEERARATGLPTLTLRLAPLLGRRSPLWLKLREGPRLPSRGDFLVRPVAERDVVETVVRAMCGRVPWDGWFEVAGPESMTFVELAELARGVGPRLPRGTGEWEPPWRELRGQGLPESTYWSQRFSIEAGLVSVQAARWV